MTRTARLIEPARGWIELFSLAPSPANTLVALLLPVLLSACAIAPHRGDPASSERGRSESRNDSNHVDGVGSSATTVVAAPVVAEYSLAAGAALVTAPIIRIEPSDVPTISAAEAAAALDRAKTKGDLWNRIRKGFALPALNSTLVADKEKFYLQRPNYLDRMMTRGSRYLYHIVDEVEKRGLPTELALLPFVESAMNPVALSSAQASGLWQFMPATGKHFNLSQNWWVDNRRDVVHSTRAALDYLQKLHALHHKDWFLALASYNWGEGAVGRSVRKNQARGLNSDYLTLDMPTETRHYVPKLMAMKNIIARSAELGLTLPDLPDRPYFVAIEKTRPIDLKLAAQFAGMSPEEFVALNPAHNRPVIAASKNNEIKLPADRVEAFLAAVAKHDLSKRAFTTWQPYTLKNTETLESVAQVAGISVAELQKANSLKVSARILPGTQILAPVGKGVADDRKVESFVAPRVYEQVSSPALYHTVSKKDTLHSIAGHYKLSVASLSAMNGGKSVRKGTTLMVRAASSHTLLTTEHGERHVVANQAQLAVADKVLVRPPARGDANSAIKSARTGKGKVAKSVNKKPLRAAQDRKVPRG